MTITSGNMFKYSRFMLKHIGFNFLHQRLFQSTVSNALCSYLKTRGLIKLKGVDSIEFLQGLVTNDVRHLLNNNKTSVTLPCLFTMLLNQKGRILYDGILYNISSNSNDAEFILECDTSVIDELINHLKTYRIRKKVQISSISNELNVWSVFSSQSTDSINSISQLLIANSFIQQLKENVNPIVLTEDPRHAGLGYRIIVPINSAIEKFFEDKVEQMKAYIQLRYKLGIGEGTKDHPSGKCFPLECNLDYLHGVSFYKGCYIGQELTARTYHTGVIRKRLMPIIISHSNENLPEDCVIQNENGENVGKLRHSEGRYGLALLRVSESLSSRRLTLKGTDIELTTNKPFWWPQESIKSN